MKAKILLFLALLFAAGVLLNHASANNLSVTSVSVTGQNTTDHYSYVKFNISWENSWRTSSAPNNWDAAWVFVKYRIGTADISLTGVNSSGTTVTVSSTAKLRVGMPVNVTSGTGLFTTNCYIASITNSTQFVVSGTPATALVNASITCHRIWEPAWLNNTGNIAPVGATVQVGLPDESLPFNSSTNPAVGAFIYRSANGTGTFTVNNLKLRWNYGANNIGDDEVVDVRVYAVEMVYVPQGSFYVGSTGTEARVFTTADDVTPPYTPFLITATPPTVQGNNAASSSSNLSGVYLSSSNAGIDLTNTTTTGDLVSTYPTGYAGFYCMKYETTQQQYVDFLNNLTRPGSQVHLGTSILEDASSVTNRYVMSNGTTMTYRNGIRCDGTITPYQPITFYCDYDGDGVGNESNDGQTIACNFPTSNDYYAYSDWSGLRPMSELEYEKACRGPELPVANEFAWGTNSYTTANDITNPGNLNEYSITSNANIVSNNQPNVTGPMRVGCFATAGSTRSMSGASYYGIMDLSGNLAERVATIYTATARTNFNGNIHGDGQLAGTGSFTVSSSYWPAGVLGVNLRGSAVSYTPDKGYISDRANIRVVTLSRQFFSGFRSVRSLPTSNPE